MVYRPAFRTQLDGSRCAGTNCGCASQAMASQRGRRGRDPGNSHGWPPMPPEIRNYIGACGGTSLNQNDAASNHLYAADMWVRYGVPWATFQSLIISGRGAIVQIWYGVIAPTRYDACPGFVKGHAVFVNERNPATGAFLVYDPLANGRRGLPQGPQWWPASLLKAAAYAFPGTATGCVNASFTADTE